MNVHQRLQQLYQQYGRNPETKACLIDCLQVWQDFSEQVAGKMRATKTKK